MDMREERDMRKERDWMNRERANVGKDMSGIINTSQRQLCSCVCSVSRDRFITAATIIIIIITIIIPIITIPVPSGISMGTLASSARRNTTINCFCTRSFDYVEGEVRGERQ